MKSSSLADGFPASPTPGRGRPFSMTVHTISRKNGFLLLGSTHYYLESKSARKYCKGRKNLLPNPKEEPLGEDRLGVAFSFRDGLGFKSNASKVYV